MDLGISQNFFINTAALTQLIEKSGIDKDDLVLDIGAGGGALTVALADQCKEVRAIEFDPNLLDKLKDATKDCSNVTVIEADFLKFPLPQNGAYKVFSNIPFSITSDIVNKLIFIPNPPTDCFLFMQKEAALRYMGVGEGVMVSLLIKPFFDLEIVHKFDRKDFLPVPSVDVVLLRFRKLEKPLINPKFIHAYNDFITFTLLQQKPTLKLRLTKLFTSEQFSRQSAGLKFSVTAKGNDLGLEQWVGLFNYYLSGVSPEKKYFIEGLGKMYLSGKLKLSGPSRTKIRR